MSLAASIDNKPNINVTPLIDVLLVLLIIFMVAAPLKPFRFAAKLPAPPDDRPVEPNDLTLVVTIEADHTLKLNGLTDMGTDRSATQAGTDTRGSFSATHPQSRLSPGAAHAHRHSGASFAFRKRSSSKLRAQFRTGK